MLRSQAWNYGQVLMDSIGPRLTGSPQNRMANDWVVKTYAAMGVSAKNEQYGTWRDWTRGPSRNTNEIEFQSRPLLCYHHSVRSTPGTAQEKACLNLKQKSPRISPSWKK